MRIVVTGRDGQVVQALLERAAKGRDVQVTAVGRPILDLGQPEGVAAALMTAQPDVVVNAAAFTAVDLAEKQADLAGAINVAGAQAVAAATARMGVPVIQLSTDYVFDGTLDRAYTEADTVHPLSVYGRSKLQGEEAVRGANPNSVILRTSWVYSPFGANFVKTMLRLAADRDTLSIVDDQIGAPSCALDIADGVLALARNLAARPDADLRGVFHMTAGGHTSWAGFASEIFRVSTAAGGPSARITPIPTAQYPTPARRPANSRLDCGKLARVHGIVLPEWRGAVAPVVERLLRQGSAAPSMAVGGKS